MAKQDIPSVSGACFVEKQAITAVAMSTKLVNQSTGRPLTLTRRDANFGARGGKQLRPGILRAVSEPHKSALKLRKKDGLCEALAHLLTARFARPSASEVRREPR